MNKEPLFISMASVIKMWEWGGVGGWKKQTLSETGWESISCRSISKLFRHHRQQIYDNIWAERAEQHIKAAPADMEGFG